MKTRQFWPKSWLFVSLFLILPGLLIISPISTDTSYAQHKKIRFALPGFFASQVLFAADRWGYLAENGLRAEIIVMIPSVAMAALSSGHVDYFAGVGAGSVSASLAGMPSRAVWFASKRLVYQLVARPPFKTIDSLRGKKIGIVSRGGTTVVAFRMAVRKVGKKPKDFNILSIPSRGELQSLGTGYVDAALLSPPFLYAALDRGYHMVLDIGKLVEMPLGGLTTLVSAIRNKPDEVKRVIRSMQQAKKTFLNSRERAVKQIVDVMKMNQKVASDTYDLLKKSLSKDGIPTRKGMQTIVTALQSMGRYTNRKVAFEDIANAKLAREVVKELGY